MMNLGRNVNIIKATSGAIESTIVNSDLIDMSGNDGCMFIAISSTATGAASLTMKAQMSTANSTAALTDVTGSTMSSTAVIAGQNYKLMVADYSKPTERYLRTQLTGSSSGTWDIIAIPYNMRRPGSTETNMTSTTIANSTVVVGLTS